MDEQVKKQFEFEIAAETDSFYSEININRLKNSIAQLDDGNEKEHDLIEDN